MTSKITDTLYLGDLRDSHNFSFPMIPVQSIIDLTGWYIEEDIENKEDTTLWKVYRMLANNNLYKIPTLVHCHAGIDRSPFIVAWFLHKHMGMTPDDAYNLVKQRHPQTIIHDDWMKIFVDIEVSEVK